MYIIRTEKNYLRDVVMPGAYLVGTTNVKEAVKFKMKKDAEEIVALYIGFHCDIIKYSNEL